MAPPDSIATELAWLSRRQLVNRVQRALRKRKNQAAAVLLVLWVAIQGIVVWFLTAGASGPAPSAPNPSVVPTAAGFLAFIFLIDAFLAFGAGIALMVDGEPFVLAVYAAPIDRRAIPRYRLPRTCIYVAAITAGLAALFTPFAIGVVEISPGPFAFRFWVLVFPVTFGSVLLGLNWQGSRLRQHAWTEPIVGAVALAALVTFTAWLFVLPGPSTQMRFSELATAFAGGQARWLLGLTTGAWAPIGVWLPWVVMLLFAAMATRVRYPIPERFGAPSLDMPFGPERTVSGTIGGRLLERLRFSYRDRGSGAKALEGEAATLSLRTGPELAVMGMVVAFSGLFGLVDAATFWLLGTATIGSAGIQAALFVLFFQLLLVMILGAMIFAARWPYSWSMFDQLRQLPISGEEAFRSLGAARRLWVWIIAAVSALASGAAIRDPVAGVLVGFLIGTYLEYAGTLALWAAPFVPPSVNLSSEASTLPNLLVILGILGVGIGEPFLIGIFLPITSAYALWAALAALGVLNVALWRGAGIRVSGRLMLPWRSG